MPISNPLIRKHFTLPQSRQKNKKARKENLANAFAITSDTPTNFFQGKRVWLVDDVATTGSTLVACATLTKATVRPKSTASPWRARMVHHISEVMGIFSFSTPTGLTPNGINFDSRRTQSSLRSSLFTIHKIPPFKTRFYVLAGATGFTLKGINFEPVISYPTKKDSS
jgi:hypothetical protein